MRKLWKKLPESSGVYLMRGALGHLLYIGKAANLRRRVQSYFTRPTPPAGGARISKLVSQIRRIDHKRTETALEALILEAALIKKYQPPFNIQEKDDTSFLYVVVTKEKFPRLILTRGKEVGKSLGDTFGPFVQGGSIREALRILRKIFPWSVHDPRTLGAFKRPCLEYELGLCPGTCVGLAERHEYAANIRHLKQLFQGKRPMIMRELTRAMKVAAKREAFEKAAICRKQLFALKHIQDIALIKDREFTLPPASVRALRIEGYDVSNISGTSASGSMVVFRGERPARDDYRLFKIHSLHTPNDVGMLREVLTRRFKRTPPAGGWPLPDLILIDGGKGQVNAAHAAMKDAGLMIPIVGLAKGRTRKRTDVVGDPSVLSGRGLPKGVSLKTLIRVRDEAHRFARSYHVRLRGAQFAR
ncbi:MAG: UvrB/UvrC motif-containing protein [Candidatus Jorgensenbacteria bacterium]|nr:UvrB/UvrC motif-containing protein [Candidatus Jorgensenbacteria bacterium]